VLILIRFNLHICKILFLINFNWQFLTIPIFKRKIKFFKPFNNYKLTISMPKSIEYSKLIAIHGFDNCRNCLIHLHHLGCKLLHQMCLYTRICTIFPAKTKNQWHDNHLWWVTDQSSVFKKKIRKLKKNQRI
jgi:hypothetical protein